MPNIVLPHLYIRRPRCPAYLLSSLSSVNLIIPHLFYFPHRLPSLLHLCCCCLDRHICCRPYPPSLSYSLYDSAFILNILIPCRSHPPLSPPTCISSSAIFILLHLCHISSVAVSIVARLCRFPSCTPALSQPPVPTEQCNQGSWAPRSGRYNS